MKSIQEKKAIEMLVAGETQEETAATVGVSTATMSRFANREDIRKIVEDCHLELAREGVQLIVEGNLRFLRAVNKLTKDKTPEEIARIVGDNKPLFDLMDKKEKRIG
ncbi:MAG: hypothetical protein H8E17_07530, partial [Deltaproteobacteria bacterium]|nr:hypothetical protein [Deltaproteobacteria bacterium]